MLNVWVAKNVVGALDHRAEDSIGYDFAYRPLSVPGLDVSLTMPYSLESYPYKNGLHPIFQMNLPEGRLRESLERNFRKHSQNFDDLGLLEVIGCSQIGRLRFSNNSKIIESVPLQSIHELVAYSGTEDLLRDLLERFAGYSGVSGVQPKVLIKDADIEKPSESEERITVKGATHIVKGWDEKEYPHLAANEFYCMKAAQRAGLDVPHITLSENNRFLIVERFDLQKDGQYSGFEDFCSLNGFGTQEKYDSSYEKLSKRIKEFVSPELIGSSLEVYFRALSLSCAVQNGDAHLKNFGVLYESTDKVVRLAPAFDIVTTKPYIKNDALALMLDGSKRFPNAERLVKFAKLHCNIQAEKAERILEEVADSVAQTMNELRLHIKDYPEFRNVGESMIEAWEDGLNLSCKLKNKASAKSVQAKTDVVTEGSYSGSVIKIINGVVTQKIGRGLNEVIRHDVSRLSRVPEQDEVVDIRYAGGVGQVSERSVGVGQQR